MSTVKLIPKAQRGWISKLTNAVKSSAIISDPAVATASGWSINKGKATQDPNWGNSQKRPDLAKLRNNLKSIALTALVPSVVGSYKFNPNDVTAEATLGTFSPAINFLGFNMFGGENRLNSMKQKGRTTGEVYRTMFLDPTGMLLDEK